MASTILIQLGKQKSWIRFVNEGYGHFIIAQFIVRTKIVQLAEGVHREPILPVDLLRWIKKLCRKMWTWQVISVAWLGFVRKDWFEAMALQTNLKNSGIIRMHCAVTKCSNRDSTEISMNKMYDIFTLSVYKEPRSEAIAFYGCHKVSNLIRLYCACTVHV